jgi:hypothetical protein
MSTRFPVNSGELPLWVKPGRTQYEQMSSGLPLKADIAEYTRRSRFHFRKTAVPTLGSSFPDHALDTTPGTGKARQHISTHSDRKGGHSGTPAIRQACSSFSISSSRRNTILKLEMQKRESACRIASQARRASAIRPAIAKFDMSIRCALG